MEKVLIVGGSGLIGEEITKQLVSKNIEVRLLGRKTSKEDVKIKTFVWNYKFQQIDLEAFKDITTIINLAGAGIADQRWTQNRKKEIYESRVLSTRFLYETIKKNNIKINLYIAGSAIGYYGSDRKDEFLDEKSESGNDFLAYVCKDWELEAHKFESICRTVIIRTGIVLSKKGGAYPKLRLPIQLGVGAPIGSGNQWISWVHIEDIANIFILPILNLNLQGVINGIAPNPVTNKELNYIIAKQLKRWILPINIPEYLLKLIFGELYITIVGSVKVISFTLKTKYFKFPSIQLAIKNIEDK